MVWHLSLVPQVPCRLSLLALRLRDESTVCALLKYGGGYARQDISPIERRIQKKAHTSPTLEYDQQRAPWIAFSVGACSGRTPPSQRRNPSAGRMTPYCGSMINDILMSWIRFKMRTRTRARRWRLSHRMIQPSFPISGPETIRIRSPSRMPRDGFSGEIGRAHV